MKSEIHKNTNNHIYLIEKKKKKLVYYTISLCDQFFYITTYTNVFFPTSGSKPTLVYEFAQVFDVVLTSSYIFQLFKKKKLFRAIDNLVYIILNLLNVKM